VTITCGYNTDANYYTLSGEKGAIHVPRGVAGRPVDTMLQVHLLEGDKRMEEHFPAENSYILELEHFARCIEDRQEPLATGQNSLKNIRIMERVFANALHLRLST
jgi:predicted dehydrogenase